MGNLLSIKDLFVEYEVKQNFSSDVSLVHALNGVCIDVNKGEIFSIAGESGCGKSTLAKSIMRLIDIKSGAIEFDGKNYSQAIGHSDLKEYYKNVQMVFQNPYSSLNPKMKIEQILREPLEINTNLSKDEMNQRICEKLEDVGLDKSVLKLYPHEFSGGQRQRIAIARALVLNPKFIVADEPVSALDVSIQAQIINLIKQLRNNYDLTFIFISHDLSVIRYISDRVAIMYLGEIVESGLVSEIFESPKHPYTKLLLSSIPEFGTNFDKEKENIEFSSELPSVQSLPKGCKFHTRCPYVMDKCCVNNPQDSKFSQYHFCKCFLYDSVV